MQCHLVVNFKLSFLKAKKKPKLCIIISFLQIIYIISANNGKEIFRIKNEQIWVLKMQDSLRKKFFSHRWHCSCRVFELNKIH